MSRWRSQRRRASLKESEKEGLMSGSIICGVDGSESAKRAARVARGLSSRLGLRLVFVRVVDPGSAGEQISTPAERLERLTGCTTDVDCGAGWLVDAGHPADRLVAAAADEEARLIVVGSSGESSSSPGLSAEVSRRAPCPVVVVPPGADGRGDIGFVDAIARLRHDSNGRQAQAGHDPGVRNFPGGIVRFSLGGHR
jgi:nucleotide-binding universal stress UspA family protein